ncbi:LIM domain-containing protein [Actinidia chinensis var. chinensis]|uniref:LIM domain-containing protein n=1 Tax=Actinidia chinensis var. chinensis TaxID=1590841 RepID=A0A2R6QQR3_ACTCC|nr:LIM domain-containing protein [Actinidia chinensis var. chinensis]
MDTAIGITNTVMSLTTTTQRTTNSITLAPSWPITRPNLFDLHPCNSFLNPKNSPNPNPRNRASPLFLTRCSTKPNTDKNKATTDKSNSNSKPNSNLQGHTKPISNQPLSASNSAFFRGLVFDLGTQNSWDSFEIGSPVVRRFLSDEKERWYMWYHGRSKENPGLGSDSVGLAVSSNGVHWERGGGPVQSGEDTGLVMNCSKDWWAFDTHSIRPCEVVIMSSAKVRANNAVYWLYYTGFSSEKVEFWDNSVEFMIHNPEMAKILDNESGNTSSSSNVFKSLPGLAMSQNGRHWARIEGEHHTGALFDVGSGDEWDSMFIASPQVVFHGTGDLRMYYHSFDVENGCFSVGIARSRDGIKWVKLGKIIGGGGNGAFDEYGAMNPRVVRNRKDGKYLMVYEGVGADGERSIGMAVSTDGLKNWERVQGVPVLKPSQEDGWDNKGVGSPCLVQMDGDVEEWRLYYRGIGERGEVGIGMAVSEGSEIRSFRRWTGFHLTYLV